MKAIRTALMTVVVVVITASAVVASDPLTDLGLRFADGEDPTTLESAWTALVDGDLEKGRRPAADMLGAHIALAAGDVALAIERAGRARDDSGEADRDDAAFLQMIARESQGTAAEVTSRWNEWLDRHPESPLRDEARLRLLWANLRSGKVDAATAVREAIAEDGGSILDSPRFVEADATRLLLIGDAENCLARLQGRDLAPREQYLEGLAFAEIGKPLQAAASFQQVTLRAPSTVLADHAALAKANIFFDTAAYRSAAEEYAAAASAAVDPTIASEASLRHAVCVYLDGDVEGATSLLREVAANASAEPARARAQFLLGEAMMDQERYSDAIIEFNEVLTRYFDESIAASAQYRVGRALDALGRHDDAIGSYEAVVRGHPLEPEAPAAAYLAGAGLLRDGLPLEAADFFQIVVDRYTSGEHGDGTIVFASETHRELTEAALCLLTLSYHRAGDLGRLSGAPHLILSRMPASRSPWRAWALLLDADGMAAMGRHEVARQTLDALFEDFPDHPVAAPATQLLAWSYAETGHTDLALEAEERLLTDYASMTTPEQRLQARQHAAHAHFNRHEYEDAAAMYEEVLTDPSAPNRAVALHQVAMCYMRLGRHGDAVDRWSKLVAEQPTHELAEEAWMRAGDVYFDAAHYEESVRHHEGLLANFPDSPNAPAALLRIAQAASNAGDDSIAVERFSALLERHPGTPEAASAETAMQTALLRLGESDGGTEALNSLIERFPNSSFAAEAQMRIAQTLLAEERFAEAAEEYRRVVSRHPDHPTADRAQYFAADAYLQADDGASARAAFEQLLVFFPDSDLCRSANFALGNLFFENGDLMRAAIQYTQVAEAEVDDELRTAAWFNLALCEIDLGRTDDAIVRLTSYRDEYGDDDRAFDVTMQLGTLYQTTGAGAAAEEEYERARGFDAAKGREAELWYRIAESREAAGKTDAAYNAFGMAAGQGDADDTFRLAAVGWLADHHEQREDWASARKAWLDLARNATDSELAAAAAERATQLEPFAR